MGPVGSRVAVVSGVPKLGGLERIGADVGPRPCCKALVVSSCPAKNSTTSCGPVWATARASSAGHCWSGDEPSLQAGRAGGPA